ncbi:hypothetical protein CFC21_072540 [Triticum aestivum]|uniref:Histidine protein methyltransferase 1 homolog n=2 Tax=Triticum aestivum TaxID=4565 RepID=A0A9R1HKW4_WHEAT|nr:hypothetical protein CFC21_072540 [Triticum aestivum]
MRSPPMLSQCLAGLLSHDEATAHCIDIVPERDQSRLPSRPSHHSGMQNVRPYKYAADNIEMHGMNIFKFSIVDIVGLSRSDLATPKGPLKCCESSLELVNVLKNEICDGLLTFRNKRVLELGCGYGLPGILSCLKGASTLHFQNPSAEIIRHRAIPNVFANLEQARYKQSHQQGSPLTPSWQHLPQDIHFYAGDWDELHTVLSVIQEDEVDALSGVGLGFCEDDFLDGCSSQDGNNICHETSSRRSTKLSGSHIVLVNEIPYSASSLQNLYSLIKKVPSYGVMYLAVKKNYIGSSSAVRQLRALVDEEGAFGVHLIAEPPEREIWKFFSK